MGFFFPGEEDAEKAQGLYEAVRKSAAQTTGWRVTDRRIQKIVFRDRRIKGDAVDEVGKPECLTGEPVVAILETDRAFLVCTPNRGFLRGGPILVGKQEVASATDFEP